VPVAHGVWHVEGGRVASRLEVVRQDPADKCVEYGSLKPSPDARSLRWIGTRLAEPTDFDLFDGDGREVERFALLPVDPGEHAGRWLGESELTEHVGVEQVAHQKSTRLCSMPWNSGISKSTGGSIRRT